MVMEKVPGLSFYRVKRSVSRLARASKVEALMVPNTATNGVWRRGIRHKIKGVRLADGGGAGRAD